MKKLISIMLAALVAASLLSACTPATSQPAAATAAAETAALNDSKQISGELEVAAFSNGEKMDLYWEEAVKEFNALYPDVKVTLITSATIEEQMRPRFVSDNAPDIYYMGGQANADESAFTAEGKFMDVSGWLDTASAIGYDGLLKDNMSAKMFNQTDKGIFGMGLGYGSWGYLYNVNMAKEHNWDPPKNWEEFEKLAAEIKSTTDIYPFIHQGQYPDYVGFGFMQGGIATDGGKEALLAIGNLEDNAYDNEAVKNAWDKLEEVCENDWAPKSCLGLSHTEAQMLWLQGKAFMLPCGNWIEGEMAENWPEGFVAGFMPSCWYSSSNEPQIVASGARVSVSASTKNPDAALEFIRVIFSKNMTRKYAEIMGSIPVMNDPLEGVDFPNTTADLKNVINSGAAKAIVEVGGSGNFQPYGELREAEKNNIAAVLSGEKTADEARADMNKTLSDLKADSAVVKVNIR